MSEGSAQNVRGLDHKIRALQLRQEGYRYREIAVQLGITEQGAHQLVIDELRRQKTQLPELADEVRRLELERLDAMQLALVTKVKKGDTAAIQTVLKIMERRAKLLGLDAPQEFTLLLKREVAALADELGLDVAEVLAEAEQILAGEGKPCVSPHCSTTPCGMPTATSRSGPAMGWHAAWSNGACWSGRAPHRDHAMGLSVWPWRQRIAAGISPRRAGRSWQPGRAR